MYLPNVTTEISLESSLTWGISGLGLPPSQDRFDLVEINSDRAGHNENIPHHHDYSRAQP